MPEDIKSLIEKIQLEGVQAAEEKAKEIGAQAEKKAKEIIHRAEKEAERMLVSAKEEVSRLKEKEIASLRQAARDVVLGLKEEIQRLLQNIVLATTREVLSKEALVTIIASLIRKALEKENAQIEVLLSNDDFAAMKNQIFGLLGAELKKGVVLRPAEEINSGFSISYDRGKSQFDFTDKAIAEYIGNYLKPKLAELLRGI